MSVLSATLQDQISESLVKDGLLSKADLDKLQHDSETQHVPFMSILVSNGHISSEDLTKYTARANKLPYVNLSEAVIDPTILESLPKDIAEHYMAVPLGEIDQHLVVAMLDADNIQAVDFLSKRIGRSLKVYAASEEGIRQVLKQYKVKLDPNVTNEVDEEIGEDEALKTANDANTPKTVTSTSKNIKTIVQDSPISKALSTILDYAATNRASDVHIEPYAESLVIRCRIDGILKEIMKLPKSLEPPLISRIKILSNLKIDEHRIPQDGEFTIIVGGREIDLRIAIAPVIWGEQVVIRLLDKTGTSLKLEDMGYSGRSLRVIRHGIAQTNGMVLTSGPTGSGKSTTLYALLQELKSETVNIVTLEDPVEYKMDGINQIQVNPDVGLTFTTGLRSILRQDPNIIMVGEIRDHETAELAVQAALTGHLVFSTLHTNSAAGILPRLLDMNIEPFLIASTVRTVIGQRLVRTLGDKIQTYQSSPVETASINSTIGHLLPTTAADVAKVSEDLGFSNLPVRNENAYTLTKAAGKPTASQGFKGRMGIYEAFEVSPKIQELILKRATSAQIQEVAQKEGMVLMREDGYLKALSGRTTIQEINRVASADAE
jgi:type IV pilus assembly protein PilB